MGFAKKVLEKFTKKKPVAIMTRVLLSNTLSDRRLDEIFANNCEQQLSGSELTFSTVANMMGDVVLKIQPSINAAYSGEDVSVSVNSVYNKLQGIETQVSRAIVRETAACKREIVSHMKGTAPPLLAGFRTKIVDGNHLRRTDSRIGELRKVNVAPLPGKSLVVLDPEYRLAVDVIPCECGHASERSLFPELLEAVEAGDAWIADRNFCTIALLIGIADRKAKFIIRQHGQMPYTLLGRCHRVGEIETGVVYEQKMHVVDEQGQKRAFRRITVHLFEPTRDGDVEMHIVTNLPKKFSAQNVAKTYRQRWKIETAFQEMAENLEGEIQTLGYPKAALFGFCMALVSFNVFSTIRAAVHAAHGEEAANELSVYYMSKEVSNVSDGLDVVVEKETWSQLYGQSTTRQIAKELQRIAKAMQLKRYKKNKWTPKSRKKSKKNKTNRGHDSTYKILMKSRNVA